MDDKDIPETVEEIRLRMGAMTDNHDYEAALEEMVDGRAGVADWFIKHRLAIQAALQQAIEQSPKPPKTKGETND